MNAIDSHFAGKRVLITGGVGFIGSWLARRLVGAGARVTYHATVLAGVEGVSGTKPGGLPRSEPTSYSNCDRSSKTCRLKA